MSRYEPASGKEHDADLVITACFLSVPVVALLYSLLCFAVALGVFCVQSSDAHGKIILMVTFAVACSVGLSTLAFFWHTWRGPPSVQVSDDDGFELYMGWGGATRKFASKVARTMHAQVRSLRRRNRLKEIN